MGKDYIPTKDADFDVFQDNFMNGVQPRIVDWGIPQTEFDALVLLQVTWDGTWAKASDKDSRSRADVQAKKSARKAYEAGLRRFIREWIAFNSKVTDSDLVGLGLKRKDLEPTPAPVPDRAPDITIDAIKHLVHKLRLTDPANPETKSKPKGMRSMQVFRFIGTTPPADYSQYSLVGDATRFLFNSNFIRANVGQTVWYIVRYVNTRGIPGPWSNTISVTIA